MFSYVPINYLIAIVKSIHQLKSFPNVLHVSYQLCMVNMYQCSLYQCSSKEVTLLQNKVKSTEKTL